MEPQEIFDTVAKHLLAQGKQSIEVQEDGSRQCMYRGTGGLKCAAGILIKDEDYFEEMECNNAEHLPQVCIDFGKMPLPYWWVINSNLIKHLQQIHDTDNNWKRTEDGELYLIKSRLRQCAELNGLDSAVVE